MNEAARTGEIFCAGTQPRAVSCVVTADGGGSNGSRVRPWKLELQRLADELNISIEVHHLPPGTSKWNKIEHRLFSFITQNWRARPLVSYRVIVDLIAATTTQNGLKVLCELDDRSYPKGIVVSDEEMASLNIKRADLHGEWNYTIASSNQSREAVVSRRALSAYYPGGFSTVTAIFPARIFKILCGFFRPEFSYIFFHRPGCQNGLQNAEPRAPFIAELSRVAVDHSRRHPASFQGKISIGMPIVRPSSWSARP